MIQTFIKTSPFGHLLPSLSAIFYHPLSFIQDALSVLRLHQDYITEKVEYERARNILDAQKRRIYRRAHGMEDLDRDEDQGVDVRGIVPWDDGLTKREREAGGIGANRIKMISAVKFDERDKTAADKARDKRFAQQAMADIQDDVFIQRREAELGLPREDDPAVSAYTEARDEAKLAEREMGVAGSIAGEQSPAEPQRRRKLWFGIW